MAVKPRTPKPTAGEGQQEVQPTITRGIRLKAAALGRPATLVIGRTGTGKSTLAINTLLASEKKPLWLALNNTSALAEAVQAGKAVGEWEIEIPEDWEAFNRDILRAAKNGDLKEFDALVIDGGDVLMGYATNKIAPNGSLTQADWLAASNLMRDSIVALREHFSEVIMVVDVVKDPQGGYKINLNRHAQNLLIQLFGNKWYTATKRERAEGGKATGKMMFTVQYEPSLALDLVTGNTVMGTRES